MAGAEDEAVEGAGGRGRGPRHKPKIRNGVPVTKLGRLVKDLKIKTLEHIYLFSLPIKVSLLLQ